MQQACKRSQKVVRQEHHHIINSNRNGKTILSSIFQEYFLCLAFNNYFLADLKCT
jgi:hypothetical protein